MLVAFLQGSPANIFPGYPIEPSLGCLIRCSKMFWTYPCPSSKETPSKKGAPIEFHAQCQWESLSLIFVDKHSVTIIFIDFGEHRGAILALGCHLRHPPVSPASMAYTVMDTVRKSQKKEFACSNEICFVFRRNWTERRLICRPRY